MRFPRFIHVMIAAAAPLGTATAQERYDLVIRNGTVIDGTGAPGVRADIGIRRDRIVLVSATEIPRAAARRSIDAAGLVVAPGFIDLHAHIERIHDRASAESKVRDGVTLAVGGPDGGGPWPFGRHLNAVSRARLGINVAWLVGHNAVRRAVMGTPNRAPTADELQQMRALVAEAMGDGAFGFSTGLIYIPGAFAATDEIVALSRVAADSGGIYTSHIRNEGPRLLEAVLETIEIGRQARIPVVVTHHKAVGILNFGRSEQSLAVIDSARRAGIDVMVDQYPYTATSTSISSLWPPWALADGDSAIRRRLRDPVLRDSIVAEIVKLITERDGGDLRRTQFARVTWQRSLEGRTLHDWAVQRRLTPDARNGAELVIEAVRRGNASVIYHTLDETDVVRIMQHPTTMIASDGSLAVPGDGKPHPRAYGTFARVLGRYARELNVLSLEQAVHKMTGLPAARLGLRTRGRIAEGYFADIVVFNPETVRDRATFLQPHQYSAGIDYVIVNGVITVSNGRMTAARAGRVIRRSDR